MPNLTGRPMYQKANAIHDEASRKNWAKQRTHCQICGRLKSKPYCGVPHQTHHIIRGSRSDEPCNFLFVDARCHDLIHDGQIRGDDGELLTKLSLGHVLTIKRIREPEEFDAERLAVLFGGTLPDELPIPDFLEIEYRKNRPEPYRPWEGWPGVPDAKTATVIPVVSATMKPVKQKAAKVKEPVSLSADKRCARCIRTGNTNLRRDCPACLRIQKGED